MMVLNQVQRRFLANPRNPGDVIGCITGEPHDINHLVRLDTVGLLDKFGINGRILHGIPDNRLIGHQLNKILVAGDHNHSKAFLFGNPGICSNEVIGLKTLHFNNRKL